MLPVGWQAQALGSFNKEPAGERKWAWQANKYVGARTKALKKLIKVRKE